jgi:hypothetical protein
MGCLVPEKPLTFPSFDASNGMDLSRLSGSPEMGLSLKDSMRVQHDGR